MDELYRYESRDGKYSVQVHDDFMRECPDCGEVKPISAFGFRMMSPGQFRDQPKCSPCRGRKKEEEDVSEQDAEPVGVPPK
jgi:hypothetical protein